MQGDVCLQCPASTASGTPVANSQIRIMCVVSTEASIALLGLSHMSLKYPMCPRSVITSNADLTSHTFISVSSAPVITNWPV
jgi:hypothetical protein